ncbi:MAG TPA: hypothetical protein VJA47_05740 [archaeon]|nr:hypothetical protein [archaeon]
MENRGRGVENVQFRGTRYVRELYDLPENPTDACYDVVKEVRRINGKHHNILICVNEWGGYGEFLEIEPVFRDVFGSRLHTTVIAQSYFRSQRGFRPILSTVVDGHIITPEVKYKGQIEIPERKVKIPENLGLLLLFDDWCVGGTSLLGLLEWGLDNKGIIGYKKAATMVINDEIGASNFCIYPSSQEDKGKPVIRRIAEKKGVKLDLMHLLDSVYYNPKFMKIETTGFFSFGADRQEDLFYDDLSVFWGKYGVHPLHLAYDNFVELMLNRDPTSELPDKETYERLRRLARQRELKEKIRLRITGGV